MLLLESNVISCARCKRLWEQASSRACFLAAKSANLGIATLTINDLQETELIASAICACLAVVSVCMCIADCPAVRSFLRWDLNRAVFDVETATAQRKYELRTDSSM